MGKSKKLRVQIATAGQRKDFFADLESEWQLEKIEHFKLAVYREFLEARMEPLNPAQLLITLNEQLVLYTIVYSSQAIDLIENASRDIFSRNLEVDGW